MARQFLNGEPLNILKHKKISYYQGVSKSNLIRYHPATWKFFSITYPDFSSGFRVKFCIFWNSWNDVQTSKLIIDPKFNVIILTNIIFNIKTSFFKDLEIINLDDDFQVWLLDLQFINMCLFQSHKFRNIQEIKCIKTLHKKKKKNHSISGSSSCCVSMEKPPHTFKPKFFQLFKKRKHMILQFTIICIWPLSPLLV